ncbi:hypothetical protein TPHA_0E01810 [Tetrapisispora phaffii CBS 4417]|uniref:Ubiquitin-like domain-containing protein n=1 Tax=Tetrapisispora phaffii (strain ATCC 24235 / CBS 4417 / NBRC 1672 / NRRL Y-8282 / UCD 70-5) TaxID=1071381 RepID=G8BTP6_TETPH|nr:hypothetical protein TPHA_0E01810 [Tetrapisispora phaffii CBS 4417]CCE63274.1 hypothetical protein TPHA_0E01810 [Tetrapisispora phaffii CBS 4417]
MSDDGDDDDFFMNTDDDPDSYVQEEQVFVNSTEQNITKVVVSEEIHNISKTKVPQTSIFIDSESESETGHTSSSDQNIQKQYVLEVRKLHTGSKRRESDIKSNSANSTDFSDTGSLEMVNYNNTDRTYRSKRRRSQRENIIDEREIRPSGIDADDEFFKAIREASKRPSTLSNSGTPEILNRKYNIMYISKLNGSEERRIQAKVLGTQTFAKVLPPILNTLLKVNKIPSKLRSLYKAENVTLYWNKSKLLNFMNCDSLKIPQTYQNEISELEIILISKEEEQKFEEQFKMQLLEDEQLSQKNIENFNDSNKPFDILNTSYNEYEKELENWNSKDFNVTNDVLDVSNDENSSNNVKGNDSMNLIEISDNESSIKEHGTSNVIKISLMSNDNKKIFVNVRSSTKIQKLVDYFKKCKNLTSNQRIKVIFDHDVLSLDSMIGDNDIEDEDIVEMIIE